MPVNRNALIRYRTIDNCLRNRYRKWTLDDLIHEVSETLYDYEGIEKGVSKRTVQMDLQMMRSDKLGYNAPIIVTDKKYYTYEDPEYSITNIPLTDQDLHKLSETVDFLKQFKGFSHFRELDGMVQKLEDHVYSRKTKQKPVIDFEKNDELKGLEYLDTIYRSILKKNKIELTYRSFKARQEATFRFSPFLLKEFKNRWFMLGKRGNQQGLVLLALDRIIRINILEEFFTIPEDFDAQNYFNHVIGVSVNPTEEPEEIVIFVTRAHAPYVITKPLHASQKILNSDAYGTTISIRVQHNFELEKEILGFGDGMRVVSPLSLRRSIMRRIANAHDVYETELDDHSLQIAGKRLHHKGSAILNHLYTRKELRLISKAMDQIFSANEGGRQSFYRRAFLQKHPGIKKHLFNRNLRTLIGSIDPNAFLVKSIYFDKPPASDWFVTTHQDLAINVKEKIATEGFSGWTQKEDIVSVLPPEAVNKNCFTIRIHLDDSHATNGALKIMPGSHRKRLSDEEIKTITDNSIPLVCEVMAGGVHLMKPLLLHASPGNKSQKNRRVIHLEFSSMELAGDLEWAERDEELFPPTNIH